MASCDPCSRGWCWACEGWRYGHPCTHHHGASPTYWGRSRGPGARLVYRNPLGGGSGGSGGFLRGLLEAALLGALRRRRQRRYRG